MATLLPSWLAPKPKVVDLRPFCGLDSAIRFPGITVPFIQEGDTCLHRYATDARICVRTAAEWYETEGAEQRGLPNAARNIPWDHDKSRGWKKWPAAARYEDQDDAPCPMCGEIEREECPACEGYGENYVEPHSWQWCKVCGGDGILSVECRMCKGVGSGNFPNLLVLPECNLKIARKYDQKIRTLSGVEFLARPQKYDEPIRFRFDGGEGLVMAIAR